MTSNSHKRKQNMHDDLVEELYQRLRQDPKYDHILLKNYEYSINGLEGEVDVLAWNNHHSIWHFYEVKTNWTPKQARRAQRQYDRFKKAHGFGRSQGVLYTSQCVRRLR